MRLLPLTKGYQAQLDDDDYELVKHLRWHAMVTPHTTYASTSMRINGRRKEVRLHVLVMNTLSKKIEVDHRDGNGLNNQRYNLRLTNRLQQTWNMKARGNTVKSKGVTKLKRLRSKPFQAKIKHGDNHVHLGYFASEVDAARAYDQAAFLIQGEYARINDEVHLRDTVRRGALPGSLGTGRPVGQHGRPARTPMHK